jgi:plasmid maintenance system antidote protein VapI
VNVTQDDDMPPRAKEITSLAEYLKANGLTQSAFAEMIGTHQVNLNRVINGKRRPSWSMISRIRKATGGVVDVQSWLPENLA